ncbi:hypothetical protein D0863_11574, partial [Hortaea werneckii]
GAKANQQPTTRESKRKFRELKNERTVLRDFLGERANQVARTSRNHGSRSDIVEEHRALMELVHSVPYDAEKYRFAQQQRAQRKAQSDAAAALGKATALPPWEDKTALLQGEEETAASRRSVSYTPPDIAASILALKSEEEGADAKRKAGEGIAVRSASFFSPTDLIFAQERETGI